MNRAALHDFGGSDSLRGNISQINQIPFAALEAGSAVWGSGFTPEGIDQNPAFCKRRLDRLLTCKTTCTRPERGSLTRNAIALRRVDHRPELAHGELQRFAPAD